MKKSKTIYLCQNCGNEFMSWSGKCEACGEWNSLKEIRVDTATIKTTRNKESLDIKKLEQIEVGENRSNRISTGISELDRVLGGGLVRGSVVLLGGEPGIGKSTLTLQFASKIPNCLYLSAEESLPQIKIRADRIKIDNKNMSLVASGDLEQVLLEASKMSLELLVIDSIQAVFLNSIPATPGSMVQVRECGIYLQNFAKKMNIATLIIGHVTKEGTIAGPKIVEHLVDTVLFLEGERFLDGRILRSMKNRFGPTNEIGVFMMGGNGMKEITNPSELFLLERENRAGSVVTATLEGSRPLLVEIQALTLPTHFGYPKRTASGFDLNRLNLLAAVIQKGTGINLSNHDIYLNVVGGMKISEPAADLAVCASIISSYKNIAIKSDSCIWGEVGLMGEVRRVTKEEIRQKESIKLGYKPLDKPKDLRELNKVIFS